MPTPAKLVAALLFAALAWLLGEIIVRTVVEEGRRVGFLREMLAAGGLIVGWRVIGRETTGRLGRGTNAVHALTAGIAAAAALLVLGVLLHSFGVMIGNALDRKYTAIGTAASAWMTFLWSDLVLLADWRVLGTLFGGGAVVGLISGLVGRRIG